MVHWFSTRSAAHRLVLERRAQRRRRAGRELRARRRHAVRRLGRKVLLQCADRRAIAVVAFFLLEDTPQSDGLPAVEEYRNDYPPATRRHEQTLGFREIFSSTCCRTATCGRSPSQRVLLLRALRRRELDSDLPRDREGFSFQQSSIGWSLYELRRSRDDRVRLDVGSHVQGPRAPATILFMALTLVAVIVYWLNCTARSGSTTRRSSRSAS
jgi:OPA family glycerol-3-phosphate transporter-like MFS transporter